MAQSIFKALHEHRNLARLPSVRSRLVVETRAPLRSSLPRFEGPLTFEDGDVFLPHPQTLTLCWKICRQIPPYLRSRRSTDQSLPARPSISPSIFILPKTEQRLHFRRTAQLVKMCSTSDEFGNGMRALQSHKCRSDKCSSKFTVFASPTRVDEESANSCRDPRADCNRVCKKRIPPAHLTRIITPEDLLSTPPRDQDPLSSL